MQLLRSFSERCTKGSFPSAADHCVGVSNRNRHTPIIPGIDPTITASTPRKRKKQQQRPERHPRNNAFFGALWTQSIKNRVRRGELMVHPTRTTTDRSPKCRRNAFDWWILNNNLRTDTLDDDETPLMESVEESNNEYIMLSIMLVEQTSKTP